MNSNTAAFVSMINTLRATDHFNKVLFSGFVKKVGMLNTFFIMFMLFHEGLGSCGRDYSGTGMRVALIRYFGICHKSGYLLPSFGCCRCSSYRAHECSTWITVHFVFSILECSSFTRCTLMPARLGFILKASFLFTSFHSIPQIPSIHILVFLHFFSHKLSRLKIHTENGWIFFNLLSCFLYECITGLHVNSSHYFLYCCLKYLFPASLSHCFIFLCQTNKFNKTADRAVCFTDKFIYKLDPRKGFKPMKAGTPVGSVSAMRYYILT